MRGQGVCKSLLFLQAGNSLAIGGQLELLGNLEAFALGGVQLCGTAAHGQQLLVVLLRGHQLATHAGQVGIGDADAARALAPLFAEFLFNACAYSGIVFGSLRCCFDFLGRGAFCNKGQRLVFGRRLVELNLLLDGIAGVARGLLLQVDAGLACFVFAV